MGDGDDDSNGVIPDSVSEIKSENYLDRMGSSLGGMLFGLILLVLGAILLYWNEGRSVEAMSALKQGGSTVVEASSAAVDPSLKG